jgi:hypothetical protein
MQEHDPSDRWLERRRIEPNLTAGTPVRVVGAALCAFRRPTSPVYAQQSIWTALTLRALAKENCNRLDRGPGSNT